VPAHGDRSDVAAAPTPPAPRQVSEQPTPREDSGPGLRVFEGACIGCHHLDGKGAVSHSASLIGSRTVNDPAGTNATKALIEGTHLLMTKTAGFMPDFGAGYSDSEIAAVVNYVTGRFGATPSKLTQADIAALRKEN
jgi:mono/diheme cytochrome c family protein